MESVLSDSVRIEAPNHKDQLNYNPKNWCTL